MRKLLLFALVVFVGITFIVRLYYLQVYDSKNYDPLEDTAVRKVFTYPKRGYVYDRNGELLVANQPSYDVMVIPKEVEPLDTLEFCSLLKITKENFIKTFNKARNYSPRLPYVFLSNLAKDDYAVLQEKMRKYDGFYIQKRSIRTYRKTIGANVLGDIGEVNQVIINKDDFANDEPVMRFGLNGGSILFRKEGFTEGDIPHLNYDSIFAQQIIYDQINRYIPNSFLGARTRRYLIDRENFEDAFKRLKYDKEKHLIVGFGFFDNGRYHNKKKHGPLGRWNS